MKTYSEKLKDPRWIDFRKRVFEHHGNYCDTCGHEDVKPSDFHHVHHKRYMRDLEPWEYDMDDVTVLCWKCHDEIHACETAWRNLIRSLPSWCMTEFQSLVESLERIAPADAQGVAAFAKNHARAIYYGRGEEYGR